MSVHRPDSYRVKGVIRLIRMHPFTVPKVPHTIMMRSVTNPRFRNRSVSVSVAKIISQLYRNTTGCFQSIITPLKIPSVALAKVSMYRYIRKDIAANRRM